MTYTKHESLKGANVVDNANDVEAEKDHTGAHVEMEDETLEHEKGSTKGKTREQPRDHGYSWVILIGGTLEMALLIGLLKSSGLMFVAFQEKFKSNSSMTSLPSTVQNICFSVMALFVLNIGLKVTTSRKLLMFGSVLMCVAYVITSQAEDVRVLMFSHGVLHGIANAFMQPTTVVTVSQYFDKRRGFANSLAVSGSCLGGLVYAPLITKLLEWYGYQGCFLIIAAITLNGCVCGALFRPISFYTKRHSKKNNNKHCETTPDTQCLIPEVKENVKSIPTSGLVQTEKQTIIIEQMGFISSTRSLNHKLDPAGSDLARPRALTFVDRTDGVPPYLNSKKKQYSSKEFMSSSMYDIPAFTLPNSNGKRHANGHIETGKTSDTNKEEGKRTSWFRDFVNLFDYKVFKEPVFVAFLISASFTCPSTVMVTVYIAPYGKDIGVSTEGVAELVLVYTAVDLVSRVSFGYISDKGWLRRSTLISITTFIVSISSHLLRFYTSYNSLIVFAVVLGLVSGLYFSIYPVVITDYMSLDRLKSCLGFTALFHGFTVAGTFFLVGYLRDISGSYILPYHFIGTQAFIGGVMMFSLPFIERYHEARKKEKSTHIS